MFKKMKFQDVHIDQNIQQRTIIQDLTLMVVSLKILILLKFH